MTHRRPYLPAGMRETILSSKCSLPQSSVLLAPARLRLSSPSKPSARRRQSVHFANGNPANSMKTNHGKNSNRYTFPRVIDGFPLRPQRLPALSPWGAGCDAFPASRITNNEPGLEIVVSTSKHSLGGDSNTR